MNELISNPHLIKLLTLLRQQLFNCLQKLNFEPEGAIVTFDKLKSLLQQKYAQLDVIELGASQSQEVKATETPVDLAQIFQKHPLNNCNLFVANLITDKKFKPLDLFKYISNELHDGSLILFSSLDHQGIKLLLENVFNDNDKL